MKYTQLSFKTITPIKQITKRQLFVGGNSSFFGVVFISSHKIQSESDLHRFKPDSRVRITPFKMGEDCTYSDWPWFAMMSDSG